MTADSAPDPIEDAEDLAAGRAYLETGAGSRTISPELAEYLRSRTDLPVAKIRRLSEVSDEDLDGFGE